MTVVKQIEFEEVQACMTTSHPERYTYIRSGLKKICWTDPHGLKVGCVISFKNEDRKYIIDKIHDIEMDHREINRTWHVGGL